MATISKTTGAMQNLMDPATGNAISKIPSHGTVTQAIQNQAEAFWALVSKREDTLRTIGDEVLYTELETKKSAPKPRNKTYIVYKFEKFATPSTQPKARTLWDGWCVPSALAELVWIWGDQKYNGTYLPHVDDRKPKFKLSFTDSNKKEHSLREKYWISSVKNPNDAKNWINVDSYYVGMYEFRVDIEEKGREIFNKNKQRRPLVNLDAIKVLSKKIDNGLYYDIINNGNVGSNWDGGMYGIDAAKAVKKITNDGITYVTLTKDNTIAMYNHIKSDEGPVLDSIRTSDKGDKDKSYHVRLLIGVKYYASDIWTKATSGLSDKQKIEKRLRQAGVGYNFLIWDNGFSTGREGYTPYWEASSAMTDRRKGRTIIGFKY